MQQAITRASTRADSLYLLCKIIDMLAVVHAAEQTLTCNLSTLHLTMRRGASCT